MAKLTVTELKKQLAKKTKEELIREITTLYQKIPEVKEFYQLQVGEAGQVAEKYKDIILKEFAGKGRALPKARLSVGKKAISDFKKLTNDPELIADVMLTYVESVSSFNEEYSVGDEDYYTSPEDMFEEALALIKENGLLPRFKAKAQGIVKNATDSFGHRDTLRYAFEEVYGKR